MIFTYILFGIMAILGGIPSLYLLIGFPAVIIYKIVRMIKYGYKITD